MARPSAVVIACLLLAAGGARAQSDDGGRGPAELSLGPIDLNLSASRGLGRNMDEPRCGTTFDAKFAGPVRFFSARGEALAFERLGLFVASQRIRLGDGAPVFDFEGGAALVLGRGVELTGGYRVFGLDFGGAEAPDPGQAPVLGVRLSF